jgi:hypothetical protein
LLRILIILILKRKHNIAGIIIILIKIIRLIILLTRNLKKGSNSGEISLIIFFLDLSDISLFISSFNPSARVFL